MSTSIHSVAGRAARCPALAAKAALMLIGFSAVIGQVVLMRELMVVFNGNEISLGILLATWLFWTAVGSVVCSCFRCVEAALDGWWPRWRLLLGVSLPATIWALRVSKSLFQSVPGELVGPVPALLASLVCLSVFCVVAGALFVAAARMVSLESNVDARGLSARLICWRRPAPQSEESPPAWCCCAFLSRSRSPASCSS